MKGIFDHKSFDWDRNAWAKSIPRSAYPKSNNLINVCCSTENTMLVSFDKTSIKQDQKCQQMARLPIYSVCSTNIRSNQTNIVFYLSCNISHADLEVHKNSSGSLNCGLFQNKAIPVNSMQNLHHRCQTDIKCGQLHNSMTSFSQSNNEIFSNVSAQQIRW